jgi:hypothetical protein
MPGVLDRLVAAVARRDHDCRAGLSICRATRATPVSKARARDGARRKRAFRAEEVRGTALAMSSRQKEPP